jgi:hypothetical protein
VRAGFTSDLRALTLDGRVVLVNKVALDQLDGQARLSHTTAADYDQLVLPEELRAG